MIDPKIAEAAFALKKDELSKPVEGQFAIVLVRVSEIVPGKQRTFDEVKGEINDRIAEERAAQEIQTLHEKVEDERNGRQATQGDRRATQARSSGRSPRSTARGKGPDGKPAIERLPQAAQVAQAAFAGGPGPRGGGHRARRRRLCLDRRARRHAREAEDPSRT